MGETENKGTTPQKPEDMKNQGIMGVPVRTTTFRSSPTITGLGDLRDRDLRINRSKPVEQKPTEQK